MGSDRKVQEAVAKLAGTFNKDQVTFLTCSVISVDVKNRTCDCRQIGGDAVIDIPEVQLMAAIDDGLLLVPAVDSTVIVCYSNRNVPYIALFSELNNIYLIAADGIQLNGGEFGGLIKIETLINKLNNLENIVNSLIAKYNSHTHILALSTGTGTAATTVTTETQTLTPTELDELENKSITHGA